ncbi:hypothetical protein BH10ACT9_BH10ACT9_43200 [soil metagenome]
MLQQLADSGEEKRATVTVARAVICRQRGLHRVDNPDPAVDGAQSGPDRQRRTGIPVAAVLRRRRGSEQYASSPALGAAFDVTLLSYVDSCGVGINADSAAIPDPEVFPECIVAGFDDVLTLGR